MEQDTSWEEQMWKEGVSRQVFQPDPNGLRHAWFIAVMAKHKQKLTGRVDERDDSLPESGW